ncbi:MAG: UpxY family transcription antiterminator [Dysgonamonadaceae bacterium]|nr:UpxY family transcription antiterminator [Dysgonamonadaceae bacterium]
MENSDICWYAAKVKYQTEIKIKTFLEKNGIECFIPFHKKVIERNGHKIEVNRPVIPTYIFIHTNKESAMSFPELSGYLMNYIYGRDKSQFTVVSDKQMQDFMFVIDFARDAVKIENETLKHGDKVRVIKGDFIGIEGELVRIKGHKRVVVRLEGLFSFATTYIPPSFLEKI